jgi:hypothetical protein
MGREISIYELRLPASLRRAVERLCGEIDVTVDEFVVKVVVKAVAEKVSATFFEERRAKADRKTFRRILRRKGGEAPRVVDAC